MHPINFINALPIQHKKAIHAWFIVSLISTALLITILGIITSQEYFELRTLKHENARLHTSMASFESTMQRKQELKKQEQAVQEQLNIITNALKQTQRHALLMANIKKSLKSWATLESFTLESSSMQLCIDCAQTQQASEIILALTQLPDIAGVHLNSLQPKQQGTSTALRLNLRGTIKPS